MSMFQNRMVSVRQILRKTRTRTIVAVIATSVLATVCMGRVVYKAISHIRPETNEIVVEAHGYEADSEKLLTWSRDIGTQISEIREYLSKLEADVASSSTALEDISTLYKEVFEGDSIKTSFSLSDVRSDMTVLRDKIEASLIQIDLIDQALNGEEGITETVRNRTEDMMRELDTMLNGIDERYMLVQSEMNRLIVVLNQSGITQSGKNSETVETLKAFAKQETDTLAGIREQLDKTYGSLSDLGIQASETKAAIDTLGLKVGENGNSSRSIAEQIATTQSEIATLQTIVSQISADQQTIVGMLSTTNQILSQTGTMVSEGNTRYEELAAQLAEQQKNLDTLTTSVTANGQVIQTMSTTLDAQAGNINTMQQNLDAHSSQINEISGKVAFPLGIDSEGEYGYYKTGADSVTPFRRPGLPTGEKAVLSHVHSINPIYGGLCYEDTPYDSTEQVACEGAVGQEWNEQSALFCSTCNNWNKDVAAVCPETGGDHTFTQKQFLHCNEHDTDFNVGDRCPWTGAVTVKRYALKCTGVSLGQLYIENKNTKRAAENCNLCVGVEVGDVQMQIIGYRWSAENGGIISGDIFSQEITAEHRGMYYCEVSYVDMLSGLQAVNVIRYEVTNLAH